MRLPRMGWASVLGASILCLTATTLLLAAPADPGASAHQNRRLPPSACTVAISETLRPEVVPNCSGSQVTITLAVSCPARLPRHVVFVIGKHLAMQDSLDDVKQAARAAVGALDFDAGDKAGVVSLSAQSRTDVDLTDRQAQVLAAINRIQLDAVNPFVQYFDWIGDAQSMLEDGRGELSPIEIIVLYSTGCPDGFDAYCTRQVGSAGKAKSAGMALIGVCNPNARPFGFPMPPDHCRWIQQMASPGRYHDLPQAGRVANDFASLEDDAVPLGLKRLELVDRLMPGLDPVAGSAVPTATLSGSSLAFGWSNVASGSLVTATYRVLPRDTSPTQLRDPGSAVTLLDSLDREAGPLAVPTRAITVVECLAPTATPTPPPPTVAPTAEPSATIAPSPSATSRLPSPAYLPVLLRRAAPRRLPAAGAGDSRALRPPSKLAEPSRMPGIVRL